MDTDTQPMEPAVTPRSHPILVVGLTAAGADGLPPAVRARIARSALLAGGERHLAAFPHFTGERVVVAASVEPAVVRLTTAWERGEPAVALASGDPLWYGIGASLRRVLPPKALEVVPAPTSAQLAFAALGEPWHDAVLLSAHGRPLAPAVAAASAAPKAAILTDSRNTPAAIATALLDAGLPPATPCAVCERLGGPAQRVVRGTLAAIGAHTFAPLNVFVLWNEHGAAAHRLPAIPPGLPDEAFSTEAGQITKREVRLLSLAELALGPGEVLWDIGAGSGAVGIESARAQPTARVFAVERREPFVRHAEENLRRHPAPNLALVHGEAPAACAAWPDPDAIFVGGSGGRLAEIIATARARLRAGGRLVLNLVALEHLHAAIGLLPDARVSQVQIGRGTPVVGLLRLEALNPVFVVAWRSADHD